MNLVRMKGKDAVCDSLDVAEHFGKRHDRVLRSIDSLMESLLKNGERLMFKESERKAADGQIRQQVLPTGNLLPQNNSECLR